MLHLVALKDEEKMEKNLKPYPHARVLSSVEWYFPSY